MTQVIRSTNGYDIFVDDDDYGPLSRRRWYVSESKGHISVRSTTRSARTSLKMHRVITQAPPGIVVDHIDGNSLNNCRANLRLCSQRENARNNRGRGGICAFKGVYACGPNTWRARIKYDYRDIHSRICRTPEEAAREYDRLAIKHHGRFARLNFPHEAPE